MKIIFFGSSKFVIPILEGLRKKSDLSLVITTENPKGLKNDLASQGDALRSWPVVKYCVENNIDYRSVSNLSDPNLKSLILNLKSPAAVLADFGLIVPQDVLNMFPKGIINIHPSLLPKYRGPTPVQTAILNGEKITGVSIMKLDEEIDHGPILGQEKEEVLDTDTSESLYKRLFEKGANLLLKVLPNYLDGSLDPIAQSHKKSTFTEHLTRESGYAEISDKQQEISRIKRKIRAYFPWPGVWFKIKLNDKEKIIKLLPNNLISQYPNNPILIQVEGKKPMTYKDFLNGYENVIPNLFRDLIEMLK